jgi:hypothetical protein
METLSTRDSHAFRHGLLAGIVVLSGALAGSYAEHRGDASACDASFQDRLVLDRLAERIGDHFTSSTRAPLSHIGQRITRAILQRAFGCGCQ